LLGHAPWFHFWYRWLDARFVGTTARIIAPKLVLDLGFAGPTYVSGVLMYISLTRTGDPSTCIPFWKEVFPTAYAVGVGTHLIFQSVNFRFVPSRQRILFDNCTSLFWKTFLLLLAKPTPKESVAKKARAVTPSTP
jgi:protein Mpv17